MAMFAFVFYMNYHAVVYSEVKGVMMRQFNLCASACLLAISSATFAADMAATTDATMPNSGMFVGIGGSNNSVNLQRDLFASGVSDIFDGSGTRVAYGEAGGPAITYHDNLATQAPTLQLGYFQHFSNSDLLWGVKFAYQYLGITSVDSAVNVPQYGSFTNLPTSNDTSFTGHVAIASVQTTVNHDVALMPFIGHSFKNSYAYFAAGPEWLQVNTDIINVIGFADLSGVHTDITGTPTSFSHANWVWATGMQVGLNYAFAPTWSLDLNYHYALTEKFTTNDSGYFASASQGYTDTGIIYANTSQRVTVQGMMLTINKVFA